MTHCVQSVPATSLTDTTAAIVVQALEASQLQIQSLVNPSQLTEVF